MNISLSTLLVLASSMYIGFYTGNKNNSHVPNKIVSGTSLLHAMIVKPVGRYWSISSKQDLSVAQRSAVPQISACVMKCIYTNRESKPSVFKCTI